MHKEVVLEIQVHLSENVFGYPLETPGHLLPPQLPLLSRYPLGTSLLQFGWSVGVCYNVHLQTGHLPG